LLFLQSQLQFPSVSDNAIRRHAIFICFEKYISLTNDRPSFAGIATQQPCDQKGSSISKAAADTTVGTTTSDSDKGEHSGNQEDGMKGTRHSEKVSSHKKGMYN